MIFRLHRRLFRRVLAELLLFDPLKNKRCWNQVLFCFIYCCISSWSDPGPREKWRLFPASELPFESSFPQFYRESSTEFPLSLKFVSKWKNLPSHVYLPFIYPHHKKWKTSFSLCVFIGRTCCSDTHLLHWLMITLTCLARKKLEP